MRWQKLKAQMFNWHGWCRGTEPGRLRSFYLEALLESGFKVLEITQHHFTPQGYTALFLLAESHFAVHTFPECGTTYLELSSCVERQFTHFVANYTEDCTDEP